MLSRPLWPIRRPGVNTDNSGKPPTGWRSLLPWRVRRFLAIRLLRYAESKSNVLLVEALIVRENAERRAAWIAPELDQWEAGYDEALRVPMGEGR